MGLFDKKYCDICGEKIGLLGNRKLEDGNMCKECAKKLSPFFSERKQSTVEGIKEQLAYREANKEKVAEFQPTKVIGSSAMIVIDEDKRQWLFTRSSRWKNENPDIIDFSQVTGCNLDIDESQDEIYRTNAEGERESYNPPRYSYSYDFNMTIHVNSPWFSKICFRLNGNSIENRLGAEYKCAERDAQEIIDTLSGIRDETRAAAAAEAAPKAAVTCPHCHATTMPDVNGCCEYCGGALI